MKFIFKKKLIWRIGDIADKTWADNRWAKKLP